MLPVKRIDQKLVAKLIWIIVLAIEKKATISSSVIFDSANHTSLLQEKEFSAVTLLLNDSIPGLFSPLMREDGSRLELDVLMAILQTWSSLRTEG